MAAGTGRLIADLLAGRAAEIAVDGLTADRYN
jgi:glycine/D-amino acid oxidase-like deaminating enzyme